MSQVLPLTFVGGLDALLLHPESMPSLDLVLSIGAKGGEAPPSAKRTHFELLDSPDAFLLDILPECLQLMGSAYLGGKATLVHCAAGLSRSVAVVACFLVYGGDCCLDHALGLVTACRGSSVDAINPGFLLQLAVFESAVRLHTRDAAQPRLSCGCERGAPRLSNPAATAHFLRLACLRASVGHSCDGFVDKWAVRADGSAAKQGAARAGVLVWDEALDGRLGRQLSEGTAPTPSPTALAEACHAALLAGPASRWEQPLAWFAPPVVSLGALRTMQPAPGAGPAEPTVYCCAACNAIVCLRSHVVDLPATRRPAIGAGVEQRVSLSGSASRAAPPTLLVAPLPWMASGSSGGGDERASSSPEPSRGGKEAVKRRVRWLARESEEGAEQAEEGPAPGCDPAIASASYFLDYPIGEQRSGRLLCSRELGGCGARLGGWRWADVAADSARQYAAGAAASSASSDAVAASGSFTAANVPAPVIFLHRASVVPRALHG